MSKVLTEELITAEDDFKDLIFDNEIKSLPASNKVGETPHRCDNCGRLLFKGEVGANGKVEIKCRCGTLNTFKVHKLDDPNVNFQDKILHNRTRRLKK